MAHLYHAAAGMNRLEQLAMEDSPVHRLHPMSKLVTTIIYMIVVISFPSHNVSGLMPFLFYPAILMPLSGTPYRPLLKRLLAALPFSLMGGISNLLFVRDTAFTVGNFAVSSGMMSFASIMLKTLFTVFAVLILIATTTFIEISCQLAALHVPEILCLQLVLIYRYLSVLLREAASMFTAYSLRAADQKGIRLSDMGSFLGQLILRSFDRAERVYQAMKCRGFKGIYRGTIPVSLGLSDWLYIILCVSSMFALRFFNLSILFGRLVG